MSLHDPDPAIRPTIVLALVALASLLGPASPILPVAGATAPEAGREEPRGIPAQAPAHSRLATVDVEPSDARRIDDLVLERGPAVLHLVEGTWIPLTPVEGRVTGGIFLGRGRMAYVPPEGVERDQLERFSGSRTLDEPFDAAYLRFTDDTAGELSGAPHSPSGQEVEAARELHAEVGSDLLENRRTSLATRLLPDLVDGRRETFLAWVDTDEHGRLGFRRDPTGADLHTLSRWTDRFDGMLDVWSASGSGAGPRARVSHYGLDVTLGGNDLEEIRATATLETDEPGVRAVRFELHPLVEVRRVLAGGGTPLTFGRSRAGGEHEDSVVVVLPAALDPGEPTLVTFVLGGDIIDAVGGGRFALKAPVGWYPLLGYLRRATYDATFRIDPDHRVLASGELVSDVVVDGVRVVRFRQELPVSMFSFNHGDMRTEVVEFDGLPPITVFGDTSGLGSGDRVRDIGIDVGNSLRLFEELFGDYPFSYMYATRIPYSHGQGFPGLLHLAAGTFRSETRGASEAFRAHEVAHQWWGHVVGWKTYRDQWLSEGFAEYSGAIYADVYHRDDEILGRLLDAWRNDILGRGNIRASFGFDRFGAPMGAMRLSDGSRAGPLSLGSRLRSSESPIDYNILVYEKGAWVLHMVRMMLFDFAAGSDAPFREMMRDFVETHRGREASTEDFRRVVERYMGGDMGWFFDQWVHGTAIPTYRWAWREERADDGGQRVRLRVRQSVEPDVPFRMPVPVRFDFAGGRSSVIRVPVSRAEQEFVFDPPESLELEDVVFNHADAVLAEVEEEG